MKRLLFIVFCLFLYSTFAWAEIFTERQTLSNDQTFTVDSDDTYYYDGNQVIDAEGHSNVTVINNGNIIAHQTEGTPTELINCGSGCDNTIDAESSVNFTLTNNGTVWAGHNRTIDLRSATGDITVTNNVGGKIAAGERVDDFDVLDLDGAGSSGDTITIVNHGTIENTARNWDLIGMSDLDNGAIINFTNTGTIRQGTETFGSGNKYWGVVQAFDSTDEINFNKSVISFVNSNKLITSIFLSLMKAKISPTNQLAIFLGATSDSLTIRSKRTVFSFSAIIILEISLSILYSLIYLFIFSWGSSSMLGLI